MKDEQTLVLSEFWSEKGKNYYDRWGNREDISKVGQKSIKALKLPTLAENCMKRAEIETISDLFFFTLMGGLDNTQYIGAKMKKIIISKLREEIYELYGDIKARNHNKCP